MDEIISGVYKITNKINNKFYIGSSNDIINTRWKWHKSCLKNNTHTNIHLQRAYNKYGNENFIYEIIEETLDAKNKEQYYIDLLKPYIYGYNIAKDVNFPTKNYKFNKKTKKIMRKKRIEWWENDENRKNILDVFKTEKSRKKRSESLKGKPKSKTHRENLYKSKRWIKLSETHKRNIGKGVKGLLCGEKNPAKRLDVRKKISNSMIGKFSGEKHHNHKYGYVFVDINKKHYKFLNLQKFIDKHKDLNYSGIKLAFKNNRSKYKNWNIYRYIYEK